MAIDADGGLLWLGFGRGVRVVGSGDFGCFVVFLAPWGASAVFVRCFIRTLLVALSPRLYCEASPVAPERYMEFWGLARALKAAKLRNFLVQFPVFSRA